MVNEILANTMLSWMSVSRVREVSITADPTVSQPDHPLADDPQASLRTELVGQLVAAQFDLEAAIAELTRDNAPASAVSASRTQLAAIGALRQQLTGADAKTLIAMRGDIATMVAASQAAAQQVRSATDAANADNVANSAQNARTTVNDVMRGMKDFDRNLQFANAQDEADYRLREDERRAYIAAEQAKGTPQGDLNASGAAVGQMADAAAHGASENPEFQQRWERLVKSTETLREQLVRDGKDVSEFDAHLRDDLRTIMRSKGVPDAKIDALFAAHADNPLDAAKTFVAEQKGVISEQEITDLTRRTADYKVIAGEKVAVAETPVPASPMIDAMAKLRASGVVVAESASDQANHGVAINAASPAHSRSV